MNWSLRVARLFGINVRIHWTLLLYAASELLRGALLGGFIFQVVGLQMAILFGIVLLHEFGHCFAARSVGGSAEEITLWPLGGMAYVDAPHRPGTQLWTAIGGPLVNVAILAALTAAFRADARVHDLHLLTGWEVGGFWRSVYRVNLAVLLFNMIPAYPMDMGRVVQCLLWLKLGYGRATLIALRIGKGFAVAMAVYGLAIGWVLGLMIGVWLFMQCEQTRRMLEMGVLEEESPFAASANMRWEDPEIVEARRTRSGGWFGGLGRWWRQATGRPPHESAERARGVPSAADSLDPSVQARVDELLAKISREGIGRITPEERKFLDVTSRKLRDSG